MKLLMARHGQSAWQVERDLAGPDALLTPLGELQAHRLGAYLARTQPVDAIHASNLKRAQRTAEIVSSYLDMPITLDEDLREFDEWDEGWAPGPVSQWDASPAEPELAPSYRRFCERVQAALQRAVDPHENGATVLIVAHGGTIGTAWRMLLGSHTPRLWTYNAALHEVEWQTSGWGTGWAFHYSNYMEYLPPFMRTS